MSDLLLLQKAVNEMNSIDQYERCQLCDFAKDDSCNRSNYLKCCDFTWLGLKPSEKGSEWDE